MQRVDRRTFFKRAGVTAAALGAAATAAAVPAASITAGLGAAGAGLAAGASPLSAEELSAAPALVAEVRDPARGEIALYVGEREVLLRDRAVASRLVRAAR